MLFLYDGCFGKNCARAHLVYSHSTDWENEAGEAQVQASFSSRNSGLSVPGLLASTERRGNLADHIARLINSSSRVLLAVSR